jgi:hypothetical protein
MAPQYCACKYTGRTWVDHHVGPDTWSIFLCTAQICLQIEQLCRRSCGFKNVLMEPSCFKNNLRACSSEDACATSSPELDGDEGDGDRCISGPESRCNRDSIFILPFELFNHLELEKEWHLHRASSHLQQEQGAKSARARPSLSQVNHNHGTGSPWIHTRRSHAKKMMEKINLIPPKGRRLPVGEGAAGSLRWRRGCISALRKLQWVHQQRRGELDGMFSGCSLPSPPRRTGALPVGECSRSGVSVISAGRACPAGRRLGRRAGNVDGLRRIVAFHGTAGSVRQRSRPVHIQRMRARIPLLRLLRPMRRAAAAGLVSSHP